MCGLERKHRRDEADKVKPHYDDLLPGYVKGSLYIEYSIHKH